MTFSSGWDCASDLWFEGGLPCVFEKHVKFGLPSFLLKIFCFLSMTLADLFGADSSLPAQQKPLFFSPLPCPSWFSFFVDYWVGLPREGVQRAPELGAGPADETGLEIGGLAWGRRQNLLSLQLQWPGRLAYPRPLPVKQHEGCPLVMPCLAVCSGVNISCRGIHLSVSGGFVKVRAYWKKRLLQFSDYFPSLTNEAAAHELQKMGMEERKASMYSCCTAFYCRSGSVQCHVCLLASLPLRVLSRFLLSDSSVSTS